jgi:Ni,Fe-hydrogenase I cytochrome b subunit
MKKWRWDFRVWHWLHATVILGLLGTVFLRKTFLSWRTNSELIVQKMGEFDIDVSIEEAKILAKAIRAPMWDWHIILGFTREIAHDIKEIPELVFNAILIFVPLHIIGILVAENRDEGGS